MTNSDFEEEIEERGGDALKDAMTYEEAVEAVKDNWSEKPRYLTGLLNYFDSYPERFISLLARMKNPHVDKIRSEMKAKIEQVKVEHIEHRYGYALMSSLQIRGYMGAHARWSRDAKTPEKRRVHAKALEDTRFYYNKKFKGKSK